MKGCFYRRKGSESWGLKFRNYPGFQFTSALENLLSDVFLLSNVKSTNYSLEILQNQPWNAVELLLCFLNGHLTTDAKVRIFPFSDCLQECQTPLLHSTSESLRSLNPFLENVIFLIWLIWWEFQAWKETFWALFGNIIHLTFLLLGLFINSASHIIFLDALASLSAMMETKVIRWMINVFEIASIRP